MFIYAYRIKQIYALRFWWSLLRILIQALSTNGHWQFNTNRNLQFGAQWRKLLVPTAQLWHMGMKTARLRNSSVALQLDYEAAWLWNSMAVIQHSCEAALGRGSPLLLDSSALPCAGLYCSLPVPVCSKMPQLRPRISSREPGELI